MTAKDRLDGLSEVHISHIPPVSAPQPQPREGASRTGTNGDKDSAEVSITASLTHQAMSISDVRMDKVAFLQRTLANGIYHVSTADVADKLVNHATKSR